MVALPQAEAVCTGGSLPRAAGDQEHVPREIPAAGRTSTWSGIVPGIPPLRSSGTFTVPHWAPFVVLGHGVRPSAPALARPGATSTTARTSPRRRRRPTRHGRVACRVRFRARYPLRNWSFDCSRASKSSVPAGSARPSRLACASVASPWARTASWSCSACRTARSPRSLRRSTQGPWVAHVSGATPLSALDPHRRRFSVHPLQTFTRARGPEQLDGAWAAVTVGRERGQGCGLLARGNARAEAVRARRRRASALPRRRRDRVELPRHAACRRSRAVPGSRRAAGSARRR